MLAEQHLKDGDLGKALAALQQAVRGDPGNAKLRIFLFQLLAVLGQWDRALNQLAVAGELDAGALAMVQTYREALRCEALRAQVFAGRRSPLLFGDPEPWLALLIEALRLGADGQYAQAQALREEAFEAAPTTSGEADDTRFSWVADADPRLGPVLEAIVNGRYYWVPFHRIAEIRIEEPADLRDVVWTPAAFRWANGGESVGLIPTRYSGSEASADPRIVLARRTEWAQEAGQYAGLGQRMLATDAGEHPLMALRSVVLDAPESAA